MSDVGLIERTVDDLSAERVEEAVDQEDLQLYKDLVTEIN